MKKRCFGCLLSLLVALALAVAALLFAVSGGFVDWRAESYAAWHADMEQRMANSGTPHELPLPGLDELSDALDVRCQRYTGNFWGECAYVLLVRYDEETYRQEKERIDAQVAFDTIFSLNRPIQSRLWYNVMGDERWQNHMKYQKASCWK